MFSWDARKAIANFEKHRVSFEEAATADLTHSNHEIRYKRIGLSIERKCFTRSLYNTEVPRWQRNDPHHQREAGEPQRAAGSFQIVRLISPIYRNLRMRN